MLAKISFRHPQTGDVHELTLDRSGWSSDSAEAARLVNQAWDLVDVPGTLKARLLGLADRMPGVRVVSVVAVDPPAGAVL